MLSAKLAMGQVASYNQHHMPRNRAYGEGRDIQSAELSITFYPGTPGGVAGI
jgi:hypothetical protein